MKNYTLLVLGLVSVAGFGLFAEVSRAEKVAAARRVAANSIVLLKNEGDLLPLKPGEEVALCGSTSYFCFRMGFGSGDMLSQNPVQYDEGLERAGVKLQPNVAKYYRAHRDELLKIDAVRNCGRVADWARSIARIPEADRVRGDWHAMAGEPRDVKAIYTIGRLIGEATDVVEAEGGFRLMYEEENMLETLCAWYTNVIVVLNVPGVIDTSFLDRYPIKAVVLAGYLGETSGDALADVLTGRVNPSGKLVDTWAKRYADYSTTDCFGTSEIDYKEGVFVGYRHFDTRAVEPRWPFGFGLSYAKFEITPGESKVEGTLLTLPVKVTNTGKCAGAEVVQVYLASPSVHLPQPAKKLVAFHRTPVIPRGGSYEHTFRIELKDSASYCVKDASWVLEPGTYKFLVGDSSRDLAEAGIWRITEPIVTEKVANRFGEKIEYPVRKPLVKGRTGLKLADVKAGKASVEEFVAQLDEKELVTIVNGRIFDDGKFLGSGGGIGGTNQGRVSGEAGEFWSSEKYGLPSVNCADGPSGVRLAGQGTDPEKHTPLAKRMVSWPCATAVAQSWDVEAAETFGRLIADDMAVADIDGWLAPGVNIHRNPLCGRNFEYFSEDPYLAGKLGAAVIRGVQTKADGTPSGRFATIKHFATNNQEFNRAYEMNRVEERALREIYLKPFEIAIKEAKPLAVMSSYNQLNGTFAAEHPDLLTRVLRGEWGFEGLVMTDWNGAGDMNRHPAAGNDVIMPGRADQRQWMYEAIADGRVKVADLQACAVNVVKMALKLGK